MTCGSRPCRTSTVLIKEGRTREGASHADGGRAESLGGLWQTFCVPTTTKRYRGNRHRQRESVNVEEREGLFGVNEGRTTTARRQNRAKENRLTAEGKSAHTERSQWPLKRFELHCPGRLKLAWKKALDQTFSGTRLPWPGGVETTCQLLFCVSHFCDI